VFTAAAGFCGDPNQFRSASRWLTYDGLDRLTVADSPLQTTTRGQWGYSWGKATYAYDGLDNLRRHTMGGVIDFAYSYSSQGHLNSITQPSGASVSSYTHNARGQMTRRVFKGEGFNLSWDSAHRVTQTWNDASTQFPATGVPVVESYRYDAHGHRARTVRGGETLYQVYSQAGDLMWERSSTGTTRKYARLGGRLIGEIENGVRRAIHTDALGSVRQKTDQFGTVLLDDVRAPYGSTLLGGSYRNGPAFTGHMEDGATGLTYMKARYYDPVAMRFISPDPVYVDLNTGANFNRYWYANNSPYTYTDPDGRAACMLIPPAPACVYVAGAVISGIGAIATAPMAGEALGKVYNETTSDSGGEAQPGDAFPDEPLPVKPFGEPAGVEGAAGPHTGLGTEEGSKGSYPTAREIDAEGKPVRQIDFTDHGRPIGHTNPHQHPYKENPTGGTRQRGEAEPVPELPPKDR
jgi:RHS repeat-associated protein